MTYTLTFSAPLNASGATASIPITTEGIVAGYPVETTSQLGVDQGYVLTSLPVYAGVPIVTQPGVYIQPSPDFVGGFELQRHPSGWEANLGDVVSGPQMVVVGDNVALEVVGPEPLARITATDTIVLALTNYVAGFLTLNIVQ